MRTLRPLLPRAVTGDTMNTNLLRVELDIVRALPRTRGLLTIAILILLGIFASASALAQQTWLPIEKDGLRDPAGPGVKILQQPREALSKLAPDTAGNLVRWVKALEQGQITPRSSIQPETKVEVYDSDVYLNLKGGMPAVRFPHRQHTEWLACSNCHDGIFKKEPGSNKLSMFVILQGEQCGVCHGAVAFPLTECSRCHSITREEALAAIERQTTERAAKAGETPAGETKTDSKAPATEAKPGQTPPGGAKAGQVPAGEAKQGGAK